MEMRKVKNPLRRRVWRELLGEWHKYAVIAIFLMVLIGFVSGMYVANYSMLTELDQADETYHLEWGTFELRDAATEEQLEDIASGEMAQLPEGYEVEDDDFDVTAVTLYENFYKDVTESGGGSDETDAVRKVRVYKNRQDFDLACVMEGREPETDHEIMIDRMHADNADIQVGDTLEIDGQDYEVVGLAAFVNYSTLYEDNGDAMFDALNFDVAWMTQEGYDRLDASEHYNYAFYYDEEPEDEIQEKAMSDDFRTALSTQALVSGNAIENYIPRYANNAINFAMEDLGSDKAMGGVLLDIMIVVLAFIFAITISTTITKESAVIGTLRASGYSRGDLLRHYITMPMIVTLLAAIIGNLLGYTLFKNVVVSMYYNSYSLPTFETLFTSEAFVKTTVIPVLLMLVVNVLVIAVKLRATPLQFLRHDLKRHKRKKAMRLPFRKFILRFRLRVFFQNIPNYIVLFIGIVFVMIMLAMAVGMPDTLQYYQDNAVDMMFAKEQVLLKSKVDDEGSVITTDTEGAEKYSATTLLRKSDVLEEEITVYGLISNSRYIELPEYKDLEKDEVYISRAYASKYKVQEGDEITLQAQYENTSYTFYVKGIIEYDAALAVFMPNDNYYAMFDPKGDIPEEQRFNGFMSDTEIEDIPAKYIATTITERDITKMTRQLDHSMGDYMTYFQYACIILSAVLMYLLTKIIIEKNENAISMTKILGYTTREIASIYIVTTTWVVILSELLAVVIGVYTMRALWDAVMMEIGGYYQFTVSTEGIIKMLAFVLIGYLLVMFFDFRRIKKVPMDQALKDME